VQCCGKPEHHVYAERCKTCGKLACRDCLYSHSCPFPFRARGLFGAEIIRRHNSVEIPLYEVEESAKKLASRLWAAVFDAVGDSYVPVSSSRGEPSVSNPAASDSYEIPEAANGAMGFEAMVFVALEAITRAQKAYNDAQLRQFAAALTNQLSFCMAYSRSTVTEDGERRAIGLSEDFHAVLPDIRAEFDEWLLLRYKQQFLGQKSLNLFDRCYLRIYTAVFGHSALGRSRLAGMINDRLGRNNVSVEAWLRDAFVNRVSAESYKINSEFFGTA
jgi:hypothetical protein